jgi:hypothetical protein
MSRSPERLSPVGASGRRRARGAGRALRPPSLRVLAAALLATTLPAFAAAQDPEEELPEAEGALFLLLPTGAKAVGLGRAMTALAGAESAWWNPAGLAETREGRFLVYRGDHPLAGEATAASLVLRLRSLGAVGASYQLMDVGRSDVTDPEGNVTGTLSGRNHLGVLSLATRLQSRLSLGVNLKIVQSRFTCRGQCPDAGVITTALALDAGVQLMDTTRTPLRLGALLTHAGSRFGSAEPLPTRLRLAAAYEVLGHFLETDELALSLAAELEARWRRPGSPAKYLGMEFSAGRGDVLYVRAGYVLGAEQQLDGAAVGVGLHYDRFDLGLAKSLAVSALQGESEPVHISFGFVF